MEKPKKIAANDFVTSLFTPLNENIIIIIIY